MGYLSTSLPATCPKGDSGLPIDPRTPLFRVNCAWRAKLVGQDPKEPTTFITWRHGEVGDTNDAGGDERTGSGGTPGGGSSLGDCNGDNSNISSRGSSNCDIRRATHGGYANGSPWAAKVKWEGVWDFMDASKAT